MSGGGGGGQTETVTRTEIPPELEPLARQQAQSGVRALRSLQRQLGGAGAEELVAGFTPAQLQAQQQALGVAGGAGGFIPTAQDVLLQTAQGQELGSFLDPTALSAFQQTAGGEFLFGGEGFDAAVQAALNQALPQIASSFAGAGAGGSTSGLAQTAVGQAATDAFARQFAQERANQLSAASALSQLGSAERQRQLGAAQALPGIGLIPSDILAQIGGQQQALAQQQLTAPITAQEILLQASGGGVPLGALLGQAGTQQAPTGSALGAGLTGGLGGALTGAAIGSAVPGLGTGFGALLGGGLGLGGGLLS